MSRFAQVLVRIFKSGIIIVGNDLGGLLMANVSKPLFKKLNLNTINETKIYNCINNILSNPSEYTQINHMFAEKAMLLSKSSLAIANENLYGLSMYISNNYSVFFDFIAVMRTQIICSNSFSYYLNNCDKVKKQMILSLLNDFETLGMIGQYTYDCELDIVTGEFTNKKMFYRYITGQFFEDFAYCEAKKVLDELSDAYGVDYEIYRNVYVHMPNGKKHVDTWEIDLIIRFDDRIFIIEVKSGVIFKVRKFYTVRMRLGIEDFSSMLLIPTLNGDFSKENEKRYGVYVSDSKCFAEKLSEMIKGKFLSDESYDDYIEWQNDYDLSDSDFQDYMDSAFKEYVESVYDKAFDEGFREGYQAGDIDAQSQFREYQKHIASILFLSGKLSDEEIELVSSCDSAALEEIKEKLKSADGTNA